MKSIMAMTRTDERSIYCVFCLQCLTTDSDMMEKETPSTSSSSSNPTRVDLFSDETVDPIYQANAHVLNQAIQKIGMGKYQVSCRINYSFFDRFGICLLVVSYCGPGFGWVAYAFTVPVYSPTLIILLRMFQL